jgi:hypothetical protein
VSRLERAVVATAEAGESGRVGRVGQERESFARRERTADGKRDAVQKIAPRQALRRL